VKTCTKCGETKPITEFYRKGNGHKTECAPCSRARIAQYLSSNPAAAARNRERSLEWARANSGARWRDRHPEAVRAQSLTRYHIKAGNLIPKPCEICGDATVDAHHDDYSKPLNVRWLCRSHHRAHHAAERRGTAA
jgi:ribosomal protein S27AE